MILNAYSSTTRLCCRGETVHSVDVTYPLFFSSYSMSPAAQFNTRLTGAVACHARLSEDAVEGAAACPPESSSPDESP